MDFLPRTDLKFIVPLEGVNQLSIHVGDKFKVTLPDRNITSDFICMCLGGKYGGIVLSPSKSEITVTSPSATITTATFHLFNFPDFFASEQLDLKTETTSVQNENKCKRVVMKAKGWIIIITDINRTYDLEKELEDHGGYVITHVGKIFHEDGSTFTSEQVDELLTCLHYFLSLVLGCWAGLALPIGFDRDGNRVFEQWGIRRIARGHWNPMCSWFDRMNGELLSEVFPGFFLLWQNILWKQPLASALYWYLEACDPSPKTSEGRWRFGG